MAKQFFRMEGFRELDRVLKELSDVSSSAARAALREGLAAAAKPITKLAKSKAKRRTGRLRRAIGVQSVKTRGGQMIVIGPRTKGKARVHHGHLAEFGHKLVRSGKVVGHVPAQPFMRPAWDAEGGDKALKRLAAELGPRIIKHAERVAKKHGVKKGRR